MLQFLSGWLARAPARLGASLEDFVGHLAYGLPQLRQDLERFVFRSAAATASHPPGHAPWAPVAAAPTASARSRGQG